jgi:hypothetical protein
MDSPVKSGADLAREGAAMFAELFPAPGDRKARAARLGERAHALTGSRSEQEWPIGFFLLGLSWAAAGRRGYA